MNTLVMLQGGHTTLIAGATPQAIENELRGFNDVQPPGSRRLFYLGSESHGDNGLIIDPGAVVALVASP